MLTKPYDFKNGFDILWFKATGYKMDEWSISPMEKSTNVSYNPFAYYEEELPSTIIKSIFGNDCNNTFKMHTAFASLDAENKNMLYKWVRAFGVPYSSYYQSEISLPKGKNFPEVFSAMEAQRLGWYLVDKIEIRDIIKEVLVFQAMLRLHTAVKNRDINILVENKMQNYLGENILQQVDLSNVSSVAGEEFREQSWRLLPHDDSVIDIDKGMESLVGNALYNIEDAMKRGLVGIKPSLTFIREKDGRNYFREELKMQWQFSSLLSALYLMVYLDWTKGLSMQHCANPKCGDFFIPVKVTTKFCSLRCQQATKQQRYRDKVNQRKDS